MTMKWFFATLAGLLVLVLAIVGVQNSTLITIHFLGWQTSVLPLWVIMVAALVSGMLLVTLITIPGRIHRYRTTRQLRHQLAAVDASIVAPEQPTDPSLRKIGAPVEPRLGSVPPVVQGEGAP
jgi:uncharacterized integral membrane protein